MINKFNILLISLAILSYGITICLKSGITNGIFIVLWGFTTAIFAIFTRKIRWFE
jgi:hypothetical protein